MLNPIYPEFTLKCPYCPKYPPTLKLGEKLAANVGNQHPAHAGLILIRSEGESDQLTPGSDQQDPSNLIRSLSRTCRAPRAHATLISPFTFSPASLPELGAFCYTTIQPSMLPNLGNILLGKKIMFSSA